LFLDIATLNYDDLSFVLLSCTWIPNAVLNLTLLETETQMSCFFFFEGESLGVIA